jgi:Mn2+/Fe2+ NRAMP family transporter
MTCDYPSILKVPSIKILNRCEYIIIRSAIAWEKEEQLSSKLQLITIPGIITGAADDDPSGIATYSQAGAKYGLGMLWMTLFLLPTMIVIQEMCARIGLLSGNGLAALIKKKYNTKIVYPISSLLSIANTINIGADLGAMSASVRIIFPDITLVVTSLIFSVFIIIAEIFIPFNKYVRVLKYLVLSLFAYVITAIIVGEI